MADPPAFTAATLGLVVELRSLGGPSEVMAWPVRKETVFDCVTCVLAGSGGWLVGLRASADPLVDLDGSLMEVGVLAEPSREAQIAVVQIPVAVGEPDNRRRIADLRADLGIACVPHLAVLCNRPVEGPTGAERADAVVRPVGDTCIQPLDGIGRRGGDDDPMGNPIGWVENRTARRAPWAAGQELDDDLLLRVAVFALPLLGAAAGFPLLVGFAAELVLAFAVLLPPGVVPLPVGAGRPDGDSDGDEGGDG